VKRCLNCKWWESHSNGHEGFCRTDNNVEYMAHIPVRQTLPGVWAKHDEVRTRPDFGCIEWEGK
jgi:hypothetical protein